MGLFDQLKNELGASLSGAPGEHSGLVACAMEMLTNKSSGGLQGLVDAFKQKGLADVVSSWVSTGNNLPISAAQIKDVLGSEQVQKLAARCGISPETVSAKLAEILPTVVDRATPEGKIPEHGVLEKAMGLLGKSSP